MPAMPTAAALPTARAAAPILVVDDDPKIAALVRAYLEREGFRVSTVADGPAALRAIAAEPPRLVVLDLMIPGIDGLGVLRVTRESRAAAHVPILVLSARGSTGDRILGLSEGADDYLPKPFSPAELVVRVKAILRRAEGAAGAAAGDIVLALDDLRLDPARHRATVDGRDVLLTVLEVRLLQALLEADGRTLTRDQLLDAIHGAGEGEALDRAVDVYVKRIREKLADDALAPRYIATVRGAGYRAAGKVRRGEPGG